MTAAIDEFEARVCGIPCIVAVLYWEPYALAKISGPPEDCCPEEGGCGEWELRDRRGRPAPWLERKLDDEERQRIDELVFERMETPRDGY